MTRPVPGPHTRVPARPAPSRRDVLRALDDLQGAGADLGWAEATGLADGLVDTLSHLLVDLADGAAIPSPQPLVVGAIGGEARQVDHASCRAAAATLRRVAPVLVDGGPRWAEEAGQVAIQLADLFDQVADRGRSGAVPPSLKGVVLRRLHALGRRLQALGCAL
jgi:hypothetical protein